MKKVFLIAIVLLFMLCTNVFADMSAPTVITYSAYVSNPEGAKYYDDTSNNKKELGTLDFGEKITVAHWGYDEEIIRFIRDGETFSDDERQKYIYSNDITVTDLSKYNLGNVGEYMTYNNAKIYSMPTYNENGSSTALGEIPNRTIISARPYKVDKSISGDAWWGDSWASWYYTSYNGINGWISVNNIAEKCDEGVNFTTCKDIKFKDGDKEVTVPMFTVISNYYKLMGEDRSLAYGEYQGVGGVLYLAEDEAIEVTSEWAIKESTITTYFEGMDLYEQANLLSPVVVENIPVGTTLTGTYTVGWNYNDWIYVTYNDVNGWLYVGTIDGMNNLEKANDRIKSDTESRDKYGWNNGFYSVEDIKSRYFDFLERAKDKAPSDDDRINNYDFSVKEEPKETPTNQGSSEVPSTVIPSEPTKQQFTMEQMIIACIACAVIVALTATVIVILANKKKNN